MLYEKDSLEGVQASHAARLRRILTILDHASSSENLMIPSYRAHQLAGPLKGYRSMSVNGNRRVVFRFNDQDVENVDLVDYH